jgi:Thioredoxin like C-terminal domain/AhpC/TSA family
VSLFGAGRHPGVTPLPSEGRLPGFASASGWLNSPPLGPDDLRGKVVLADFWTYTCINWLRTLAWVRAWHETYREHGLVVVGVHTPEFWFEHDVDNVRRAVGDLRVEYPVAIDSDYGVWRDFGNRYWPAVYLADAQGRIRYHHFGEGDYDECERAIQMLLREAGAETIGDDLVSVDAEGFEAQADWANLQSPETYLGYEQARGFASPGGAGIDEPRSYVAPQSLELNQWALAGEWTIGPGASVSNGPGGRIAFRFRARDVNLVLRVREEGASVPFQVRVDGEAPGGAAGLDVNDAGRGIVTQPRLYQLIRARSPIGDRTFEIEFDAQGVEAYVFTFG